MGQQGSLADLGHVPLPAEGLHQNADHKAEHGQAPIQQFGPCKESLAGFPAHEAETLSIAQASARVRPTASSWFLPGAFGDRLMAERERERD